ncbi:winged helix-turn-helix transcriptional regulator [Mesorhizobium sp. L-8-10]|uniref:winged helix-turn-helix transcriptional regulator n=1 Tax=Mesorhizobium sp. L-8-10 TaxID=2744523 RepID=UPI00192779BA|nr:helix-turn-helix domain-containing protein [Mesorhizobium sp. L-8-10]
MTSYRSGCPIASALDLVGDRWSLVILRSMVMGATSYSELLSEQERIATNILAGRLRQLEQAGLIVRTRTRQGTVSGAYALTEKGAALIPTLQALARWGETYIPDRWTPPDRFYAARPEDFRSPAPAP